MSVADIGRARRGQRARLPRRQAQPWRLAGTLHMHTCARADAHICSYAHAHLAHAHLAHAHCTFNIPLQKILSHASDAIVSLQSLPNFIRDTTDECACVHVYVHVGMCVCAEPSRRHRGHDGRCTCVHVRSRMCACMACRHVYAHMCRAFPTSSRTRSTMCT